jgi:hypothetical protein
MTEPVSLYPPSAVPIMSVLDIKQHLRVTLEGSEGDAEDLLIVGKMLAAETWVGLYLGVPLSTLAPLPDPIQEALRQLVAFLYDNREAAVVGNSILVTAMTPGFYDLLAPYRCYVF